MDLTTNERRTSIFSGRAGRPATAHAPERCPLNLIIWVMITAQRPSACLRYDYCGTHRALTLQGGNAIPSLVNLSGTERGGTRNLNWFADDFGHALALLEIYPRARRGGPDGANKGFWGKWCLPHPRKTI